MPMCACVPLGTLDHTAPWVNVCLRVGRGGVRTRLQRNDVLSYPVAKGLDLLARASCRRSTKLQDGRNRW